MGEKSQQSLYHYFLSQQYFIIVFPPYQYFIFLPPFFFYRRNFPQPGPKFRPLGGALGVDASAGRLCVRGASGGGRRPWLVAGLRGPWKNGGFFQVSWFPLGKKWVGFWTKLEVVWRKRRNMWWLLSFYKGKHGVASNEMKATLSPSAIGSTMVDWLVDDLANNKASWWALRSSLTRMMVEEPARMGGSGLYLR